MEKLFLVDPYDEDHKKLISEYSHYNEIKGILQDFYKECNNLTRKEYNYIKNTRNNIKESLFLIEDKSLEDICFITGEKDIKRCIIDFIPLNKKKRKLITLATDYSINTLGIKEVFVRSTDKNIVNNLLENNYEFIGEENNEYILLKESNEVLESKRIK